MMLSLFIKLFECHHLSKNERLTLVSAHKIVPEALILLRQKHDCFTTAFLSV